MMDIEEIFNFVQISDEIATSGQPLRDEFKYISDSGYQAVVNIAMHDSDDAIADEGGIVASLGMLYIHIPVPFDAPTAEHLRQFINILKSLEGNRIWVHCALNYRVSAFMYQYQRLVHAVPPVEARSSIFDFWKPDEKWEFIMNLTAQEIGL